MTEVSREVVRGTPKQERRRRGDVRWCRDAAREVRRERRWKDTLEHRREQEKVVQRSCALQRRVRGRVLPSLEEDVTLPLPRVCAKQELVVEKGFVDARQRRERLKVLRAQRFACPRASPPSRADSGLCIQKHVDHWHAWLQLMTFCVFELGLLRGVWTAAEVHAAWLACSLVGLTARVVGGRRVCAARHGVGRGVGKNRRRRGTAFMSVRGTLWAKTPELECVGASMESVSGAGSVDTVGVMQLQQACGARQDLSDGAMLVDCGSRLGPWRGKCLQAAVLSLCRGGRQGSTRCATGNVRVATSYCLVVNERSGHEGSSRRA